MVIIIHPKSMPSIVPDVGVTSSPRLPHVPIDILRARLWSSVFGKGSAQLIANWGRRQIQTISHCRSSSFMTNHSPNTDESTIRTVFEGWTCSYGSASNVSFLRQNAFASAQHVRLRGLAQSGGETCTHQGWKTKLRLTKVAVQHGNAILMYAPM